MKETFWEKRKQSLENITSERGIYLRMNRSIQAEGAFGLIKNDFGGPLKTVFRVGGVYFVAS